MQILWRSQRHERIRAFHDPSDARAFGVFVLTEIFNLKAEFLCLHYIYNILNVNIILKI